MTTAQTKQLAGMGAALLANVLFGLTFVFIKQILNTGLSSYVMLSWRMGLALLFMLLLTPFGALRLRLGGKRFWRLPPVALCEPCFYFIFESGGIARTTASESGIIIALIPIAVLVMARLLFGERATRRQVLCVLLSVAGVALVVLAKGGDASFSLTGYLLLFLAVLMAAGYHLAVRWVSGEFSSAEITFGTNLIGFLFFFVLALAEGLRMDRPAQLLQPLHEPQILLHLLYLALAASVCAFILMNGAIRQIGPTRTSIFCGFNTLTSIIFGILVLGECLLLGQGLGALLIILGVTGANYVALQAEKQTSPRRKRGACCIQELRLTQRAPPSQSRFPPWAALP